MIMSASDSALKAPNHGIYPDSGDGFLFQWPEQFAGLVRSFLGGPGEDRAA
jgi:hypothetical protein